MIDEIVRRSGLLLEVDGGERIQFAHLTLQEYFAAEALLEDESGLLKRFSEKPNTWRETAKLWCGLAPDSTRLISGIREIEVPTAFECLADSVSVDRALATTIIERMKARLPDAASDVSVARAFAALASGHGERSRDVFEFLANSSANALDSVARDGAVVALSMTNMPEAARQLASVYDENNAILRSSLVRMGDIGVPALVRLGRAGALTALDDLVAVGTPAAALGLVTLLDTRSPNSPSIQQRAAWSVAMFLHRPGIESEIKSGPLPELSVADEDLWVWLPFGAREPMSQEWRRKSIERCREQQRAS